MSFIPADSLLERGPQQVASGLEELMRDVVIRETGSS
jgi:hypothetical protein